MMNKVLSILLAVVVLFSTVNFTVAAHFCGGQIAAINAGFEGTAADCGMAKSENHNSGQVSLSAPGCCKNVSKSLSVDNFKVSSSIEIQKVNQFLLQVFMMPVLHLFQTPTLKKLSFADEGVHYPLQSPTERLAFICVFLK